MDPGELTLQHSRNNSSNRGPLSAGLSVFRLGTIMCVRSSSSFQRTRATRNPYLPCMVLRAIKSTPLKSMGSTTSGSSSVSTSIGARTARRLLVCYNKAIKKHQRLTTYKNITHVSPEFTDHIIGGSSVCLSRLGYILYGTYHVAAKTANLVKSSGKLLAQRLYIVNKRKSPFHNLPIFTYIGCRQRCASGADVVLWVVVEVFILHDIWQRLLK